MHSTLLQQDQGPLLLFLLLPRSPAQGQQGESGQKAWAGDGAGQLVLQPGQGGGLGDVDYLRQS